MKEQETAVEVSDLTVAYQDQPVLWDIDLRVPEGALMAIVGPNGAGKTTLIKSILGLIEPAAGQVLIYGEPYEAQRQQVGYVPQRGSVDWDFPTSVLDVVMMGRYGHLGWIRRPGREEERLAREALEKVGMAPYAGRQISQLSGGQQQRVFLARALVQDAEIYFMDEPFQGVDATTERAIVDLLKALSAADKTVVAVHHDLQTVPEYFDWVMLLNVPCVDFGPVGEVFTVDVQIFQASNVVSTPFKLRFDPSHLEYVSGTQGPFLAAGGNVSFLAGLDSQQPGVLSVGLAILGAGPGGGVDGNGTLCRLSFRVLERAGQAGSTSIIPFSNKVFAPGLNELPSVFRSLTLNVGG